MYRYPSLDRSSSVSSHDSSIDDYSSHLNKHPFHGGKLKKNNEIQSRIIVNEEEWDDFATNTLAFKNAQLSERQRPSEENSGLIRLLKYADSDLYFSKECANESLMVSKNSDKLFQRNKKFLNDLFDGEISSSSENSLISHQEDDNNNQASNAQNIQNLKNPKIRSDWERISDFFVEKQSEKPTQGNGKDNEREMSTNNETPPFTATQQLSSLCPKQEVSSTTKKTRKRARPSTVWKGGKRVLSPHIEEALQQFLIAERKFYSNPYKFPQFARESKYPVFCVKRWCRSSENKYNIRSGQLYDLFDKHPNLVGCCKSDLFYKQPPNPSFDGLEKDSTPQPDFNEQFIKTNRQRCSYKDKIEIWKNIYLFFNGSIRDWCNSAQNTKRVSRGTISGHGREWRRAKIEVVREICLEIYEKDPKLQTDNNAKKIIELYLVFDNVNEENLISVCSEKLKKNPQAVRQWVKEAKSSPPELKCAMRYNPFTMLTLAE